MVGIRILEVHSCSSLAQTPLGRMPCARLIQSSPSQGLRPSIYLETKNWNCFLPFDDENENQ